MDDAVAKDLLLALQRVFRVHSTAGWIYNPFVFPPEWEQARLAIKAALPPVEPVGE